MLTKIAKLAVLFTCLSLVGCNSLSSLLFYPDTHYYRTPDQLNINYQTVTLTSEDGAQLRNWILSPKQAPKATVLFLHGNGENISTHMGSIAWLTDHGYEIFLMDYRGYGRSSGVATLGNTFSDIEMVHAWLSTERTTPLMLFGQSMGGALAITYAGHLNQTLALGHSEQPPTEPAQLRPFRSIVSESAPASWPGVARDAMSQHWLTWLLQLPANLIPSEYDAERFVASTSEVSPFLLIHSKEDQTVGYHHAERLLEKASAKTTFIESTGPHIAAMASEDIRNQVLAFLDEQL